MVELPSGVRRVKRGRRTYWYFHEGRGSKDAKPAIALPGDPHDPEFWKALNAAKAIKAPPPAGTFSTTIALYRQSPEWDYLRPLTRKGYDVYLRAFEAAWGDLQVKALTPAGIYAQRDQMADRPFAANQMLSTLRTLLAWCQPRGIVKENVAAAVARLRTDIDSGTRPWPEHAWAFVMHHAPPDLQRLAFLGRATGQRRSDLIRMRPVDRHEQGIRLTISKRRDRPHWVPLLREAAATIDAWRVEPMIPYLLSPAGRPYSGDHINSRWNRWLATSVARPLAELAAQGALAIHGLRATAVVDRRLAGLAHQEISAQLGMSIQMVMHYSRFADQEALARAGLARLEHAANKGLENAPIPDWKNRG